MNINLEEGEVSIEQKKKMETEEGSYTFWTLK